METERIVPIIRDVVFLSAGTFVFVAEALAQARWIPMVLAMLFAAGPAAVSAYWSGRTPANGLSASYPPSSSSSSPSPSPSAGEP